MSALRSIASGMIGSAPFAIVEGDTVIEYLCREVVEFFNLVEREGEQIAIDNGEGTTQRVKAKFSRLTVTEIVGSLQVGDYSLVLSPHALTLKDIPPLCQGDLVVRYPDRSPNQTMSIIEPPEVIPYRENDIKVRCYLRSL